MRYRRNDPELPPPWHRAYRGLSASGASVLKNGSRGMCRFAAPLIAGRHSDAGPEWPASGVPQGYRRSCSWAPPSPLRGLACGDGYLIEALSKWTQSSLPMRIELPIIISLPIYHLLRKRASPDFVKEVENRSLSRKLDE